MSKAKFANETSNPTDQVLLIVLHICLRICIGKGAGAHQWNISLHDLSGIGYVRTYILFPAFRSSELRTNCEIVDLHLSDYLRPYHFACQDGPFVAISTTVCASKKHQSVYVV